MQIMQNIRDFGKTWNAPPGKMDEGLRAYMLGIYAYMLKAMCVTGVTAFTISLIAPRVLEILLVTPDEGEPYLTPAGEAFFSRFAEIVAANPVLWISVFIILGLVMLLLPIMIYLLLRFGIDRLPVRWVRFFFYVYAFDVGVTLQGVMTYYTGTSIVRVFFITAGIFAALGYYGYTTKRDFGPWGKFLFAAWIGFSLLFVFIFISVIVNWILDSASGPTGDPAASLESLVATISWIDHVFAAIGVLVFAGFIAYDTQRIKLKYDSGDSPDDARRKSIHGAFSLYFDFIRMFFYLLRLIGRRK